jgi:hypothetical protein
MIFYSKADQVGKKKPSKTQTNAGANVKLKKLFIEKGIVKCELTGLKFALAYAHRHPRVWYYSKPELLYAWEQVLLLSQEAHQKMDDRSQTTEAEKEAIFIRLRGK